MLVRGAPKSSTCRKKATQVGGALVGLVYLLVLALNDLPDDLLDL